MQYWYGRTCFSWLLLTVLLRAPFAICAPNCPPGKYLLTGTGDDTTCVNCPKNSWNDMYNQTKCMLCPTNQYNTTIGATSNGCQQCSTNFVSVSGADCTCPSPEYRVVGTQCQMWAQQCIHNVQFRTPGINGVCTNALTYCATGATCCSFGFLTKHTYTADAVCYENNLLKIVTILLGDDATCVAPYYMVRKLVLDIDKVVIQTPICRVWEQCTYDTQYQLRAPSSTSNRLCVYLSTCTAGIEYEVIAKTDTSDRVCKSLTVCNAESEYLLVMGSDTKDNICATATPCYPPSFSRVRKGYIKVQAVNAHLAGVNGTDAVCQTFTPCAAGQYPVVEGGAFHDRQCGPCPVGTVGQSDGLSCVACTGSTFAASAGMSNCTVCTNCLSIAAPVQAAYTCAVGVANCTRGYLRLCNGTTDAVCTQCPPQWTKDIFGVCTPCETGYYHDAGNQNLGVLERCVLCPSNMYCDSPDTYSICPRIIAVQVPGTGVVFVPSAPRGSSRVFQCVCNLAGGFDGTGASMSGCRPCEDGYYASPGNLSCTQCPVGSYSSRQTLPDILACPSQWQQPAGSTASIGSALLIGPTGLPMQPPTSGSCMVQIGASECTQCPRGNTRISGATSVNDCSMCRFGEYYKDGACVNCTLACSGPGFYETQQCTDWTDRECSICNRVCDTPGDFPSVCTTDPNGCAACSNLPKYNAFYTPHAGMFVRSASECPWKCDAGFYSPVGSIECLLCTVYDQTSCPPGVIFSACTSVQDASCIKQCNNESKPVLHSVYADGCNWACASGYTHFQTSGGLNMCRVFSVASQAAL